jgi:hypothetical protein
MPNLDGTGPEGKGPMTGRGLGYRGFERHRKKSKRHPQMGVDDRYATEQDLQALVRAKKIEKDLPRHHRARTLAREKASERKARGKSQANVDRVDNTLKEAKGGSHGKA